MDVPFTIYHHGARDGVTGSCHELTLANGRGLLVDIGLFQGAETASDGAHAGVQTVDFPIGHIDALILTHCHIDHVGRLPWLLTAGFRGPIYCTRATALLLPMVIEDALKVGVTHNRGLIDAVLNTVKRLLVPVDYDQWTELSSPALKLRFRQAGHILGSAYVELDLNSGERVVFSGDLGCKNSPLLPDPTPLERADVLVLESTYGDRNHENRAQRQQRLRAVIEHCVSDRGTVLIPAFSIGRTQELLYELEDIIHQCRGDKLAEGLRWSDMVVILDSPMAAQFTKEYRAMRDLWDAEAKQRLSDNRHPLNFERLHVVNTHAEHQRIINYLKQSGDPCIVIAASGMCTGGRMMNYLKALLPDPRTDVLFVGYQAEGTPGRAIQAYGPRGGYVDLDDERVWIKAEIHTLGGYSAHADQQELIEFVRGADYVNDIRLVHGDEKAKHALAATLSDYQVSEKV
ncbi:MAG: MBL fold metallo-hydrolase [Idiomarina sp.]|nr:MBL fold metallo-hydrolase [Idiomarina sp.]